jgi:predicted nucleic-acid-binding Zn-ribbon protein
MAFKPNPINNTCSNCGWSKNTYPKSDAMTVGVDVFTVCPKCGSQNVQYKAVSKTMRALHELFKHLT